MKLNQVWNTAHHRPAFLGQMRGLPTHRLLRIILLVGMACLVTFGIPSPAAQAQNVSPVQAAQLADISTHLQQQLERSAGPVSFLIVLDEQPALDVAPGGSVVAAERTARGAALYAYLTSHAQRTQADLRNWLDARGVAYRPFYIVNMIEVTGDRMLAQQLRRRADVRRLIANPMIDQDYVRHVNELGRTHIGERTWLQVVAAPEAQFTAVLPYGIDYTGAPAVWAMGYAGEDIVVASQDTGVQWDHPALKTQYRGWNDETATVDHVYNWFDAWDTAGRPASCEDNAQTPCDDNGHGTHTVGTLLGDDTPNGGEVLGMAPQAEWIGCRNMQKTPNGSVGTPASYMACFQFMLAPYPQGGDPFTAGRPDLAPHIINNSWGCPPSEGCDADTLRQTVETARAAGQFVVSSAGNKGAGCASVLDPIAIYDASFSVGAHNGEGNIAPFSSRGPVTIDGSGRLKPDITAPGVGVYSTYPTDRGGYATLQGTSMAAPHVAGAIALLWSAMPELVGDVDRTEQVLLRSATPVPASQCGEDADTVPNYTYGFGRLNVLAAMQMAQSPLISVTVQLADWHAIPQADALVIVTDRLTGHAFTAISDENGEAHVTNLYAGDYSVGAQAQGVLFADTQVTLTAQSEPAPISLAGVKPHYLPWVAHQ